MTIFSAIGFLVNFGFSLVTPVLPLYALTFSITLAMVGGLVASSGVSRVLVNIPAGVISDRIGVKRSMEIGLGIVALSAFVSALATNYWILLVGLVAQGAGAAIYFTTSYIGVSHLCPVSKRGKLLSLFISAQFLGATSGPILGGSLGEWFGLTAPFVVYSLIALAAIVIVHFLIDGCDTQRGESRTIDQLTLSLRNYTLASINLGLMAISILRSGLVATIVPLYAVGNLGLTTITLGMVLTIFALANFMTLFPAGSLADRYGRRPFLFASLFLSGLCALA